MNEIVVNHSSISSKYNHSYNLMIYNQMLSVEPNYRMTLLIIFSIATITFIPAFLIIYFKSTHEMKKYKWCLLNIIISSYCFELILNLWMPFPMFKIYGGYNIGLFRHFPTCTNYVFLTLIMFIFANILLGFLNFFYYQITKTKIVNTKKISISKYLLCYIFLWIIFSSLISMPIWLSASDERVFEGQILEKSPFLEVLFENENFFGFLFSSSYFAIIYLAIIYIVYFIIVIIFNLRIVYNILNLRKHVTLTIWKLQKTLYLTFLFQTLFSIIVLFGPLVFIFIMAAMNENAVYMRSTTVVIIMSTQPPVCSIIMILTIKPYRKFLKVLFCRKTKVNDFIILT